MKTVEFGGIQFTNKTPFEINDMITEFRTGWESTLVPSYKLASELYNDRYEYRSEDSKDYNDYIVTNCKLRPVPKTFAQAVYILSSKFDINDFCKRFVKHFENGIDVYSLTVADAGLINQFSGLQLFVQYSLQVLHYISIQECNTYPENTALASYGLSKQQLDWLEAQSVNYRKSLEIVSTGVNKLYDQVDKMPTTYVAELNKERRGFSYDDVLSLLTIATAITGAVAGIATIVQTCYWRMSGGTALVIAKNIKRQQQLKEALQLRLVYLRTLRDGNDKGSPAPVLEKNIQIIEDRLRKVDKELADMEKKYGKY